MMTARDCPSGVLIRGRRLNGETVKDKVLEVTGPLYANEHRRIELTESLCR